MHDRKPRILDLFRRGNGQRVFVKSDQPSGFAQLRQHQPAVTAPIVGPRTMEQLMAGLRALELTLEARSLARLDEIFPGHKPAPEDYAW